MCLYVTICVTIDSKVVSLLTEQHNDTSLQSLINASKSKLFGYYKYKTYKSHSSPVHCIDTFKYRKEMLFVTICRDFDIRVFNLISGY